MLNRIAFDDVAVGSGLLARLKLIGELAKIKVGLKDVGDGPLAAVKRLKLASRANQIRVQLGAGAAPKAAPAIAPESLSLYPSGEERLTPARRQKENNAAIALLDEIKQRGGRQPATNAERAILAKYTGNGGNLVSKSGRKGSPYEYYTPKPIAQAAWRVLAELGFAGGKVLDPCAGTGIFGATKPAGVTVDAVELSDVSGSINALLNGNCTVAPFEEVASRTPEESYDAIMTNVPFGDASMRGANALKDPLYQNEDLEGYFLLRTMRKLKPGGLAAYICPPRVVSGAGKKEQNVRFQMSLMGEFIGAYRLPNSVFQLATEADTITDLVVFKKHSKDHKAQIDACMDSGHVDVLRNSLVLWDDFIEGRYFKGEGKRFQLGEFVAKDPSKFRDVDRVVSADGGKPADVAKLMTKLGSGRIVWADVDAVPAIPAETNDGDAVYEGGAIQIMQDGRVVQKEGQTDEYKAELLAKLSSPLDAVLNAVSHAQAKELLAISGSSAPEWLRVVEAGIGGTNDSASYAGKVSPFWGGVTAALAAESAIKKNGAGFDYLSGFPEISAALKAHAKRVIEAREAVSGMSRLVNALERVPSLYAGGEFSAMWKGEEVKAEEVDYTPAQRFEVLRYAKGDERGAVQLDEWQAIYNIDPLDSDDWCLTADGKVLSAHDYYTGTYGALMKDLNGELDSVTDEKLRAKMIRQMNRAMSLVNMPDFDKLSYDLQSPFVSAQMKLQFLKENVSKRFTLKVSEAGKLLFQIDGKAAGKGDQSTRTLKRMAVWLNDGAISSGMSGKAIDDDPEEYRQLMAAIKDMIARGNAGFNVWMKSSGKTGQLKADFDISKAGFVGIEEDASQVKIDGLNLRLNDVDIQFRDYQNQAIRQYTRNMSGICALDVGLGKTLTALATIKHMHNVGTKKRTIIAVPKAVLANWQREATSLYQDASDCLFVGYRDGETKSKYFNEDLAKIPSGQYAKIFMSIDTLVSIPIKENTIEDYLTYIQGADASYLSVEDDGTEKSRIAGEARIAKEIAALAKGRANAPFFEDMGVDSVVIDEAHVMKNGKVARGFGNVKFMSMPEKSLRAMNTGVKAWFIRKSSVKNDGVLLLTATPITNSPLEIYSMMALASGDERVNASLGGLGSASAFISAYADITSRNEGTITGEESRTEVSVFDGLKNVPDLCRNLRGVALIKTAAESGLALPETIEQPVSVGIDPELHAAIEADKKAFKLAIGALISGDKSRQTVMVGSPFNLIDKMSKGVLDRDLYDNVTRYVVKKADIADAAVEKFNKLGMIDKGRSHNSYLTRDENVVATYDLKAEDDTGARRSKKPPVVPYSGDIGGYAFDVKVIGERPDMGKEIIAAFDTVNPVAQERAIKTLGEGNLDVTVSPKIAALIENIKKEMASPVAGSGGKAKQIIFCDMLGAHSKLRLALTTKAGVPSGQIAIISGAATPEPEDVQDVADGFNGMGEDNRYTIVIANKKAEVGINLQKGTQAVHHLTTGWTPDSLQQRNGRAVRQGNLAKRVTVYHYDAEGSFDAYKRNLLDRKGDWITSVISGNGGEDRVKIGGAFSKQDLEKMGEMFGDPVAVRKFNAEREERERERVASEARAQQVSLMRVIKIPADFVRKYGTAGDYARGVVQADFDALKGEIKELGDDVAKLQGSLEKIANQKSETAIKNQARLEGRIATAQAAIGKKQAAVDAIRAKAAEFKDKGESSFIYKEWEEAKARNQAILDQTKVEFGRVKNGHAATAIEDYLAGKGQIINGEYVAVGMIAQTEDGALYAVTNGNFREGLVAQGMSSRIPASAMNSPRYFSAASPKWDAMLQAIAEIDAKAMRQGGEPVLTCLVPAAAQYLPDDLPVKAKFNDRSVLFKAPAFAIPVNPDTYHASPFITAVLKSQEGMFLSHDHMKFSAAKDSVKLLSASMKDAEIAQCLIDFCRQKGVKVGKDGSDWLGENSYARQAVFEAVFELQVGMSREAFAQSLASKAFASESEVDDYVNSIYAKAEAVMFTPRQTINADALVAKAKTRVALAQYGEHVQVIEESRALPTAAIPVWNALDNSVTRSAAQYVGADGSPNVEFALAEIGGKRIQYQGNEAVLCQQDGVTFIFAESKIGPAISKMAAYIAAVSAAAESALPGDINDKMDRLRAVSGVDSVGIIKMDFTASQYGGKTVRYPAYGAVYVVTPFGSKAHKRIQGSGFHFEKFSPGGIPKSWVVSIAPGPDKKTIDDLLIQLGA